MTVPCEGQLLLMTPPFDDLVPEPIVLGTMQFCSGLMDEHNQQVNHAALHCIALHCIALHCTDSCCGEASM